MKARIVVAWTVAGFLLIASRMPRAHAQVYPELVSPTVSSDGKNGDSHVTDQSQSPMEEISAEEKECLGMREVVDPCPELSANDSLPLQQLEGVWQVVFGYARALTTRALCPRVAFARTQGPCFNFSWGPPTQGGAQPGAPLPAAGFLRLAPPSLLAPPAADEPVLKVLQVEEPFAVVAVCSSSSGPRRILGLGRMAVIPTAPESSTDAPGATAAALSFWASVHAPLQRAGGPAWYLCARAWGATAGDAKADANATDTNANGDGDGDGDGDDQGAGERAFEFADAARR